MVREPGAGDQRLVARVQHVAAALARMRGDLAVDELHVRIGAGGRRTAVGGEQEEGEEDGSHRCDMAAVRVRESRAFPAYSGLRSSGLRRESQIRRTQIQS